MQRDQSKDNHEFTWMRGGAGLRSTTDTCWLTWELYVCVWVFVCLFVLILEGGKCALYVKAIPLIGRVRIPDERGGCFLLSFV